MALKQKCLGLTTKLEVISLCKDWNRKTSPLLTNPETENEISSVTQYDGTPLTETNEQH
jgi:hypothetical protein